MRMSSTPRFFQLVEYGQPELRGLMLADVHAQNILAAIQIHTDDHINSLVDDVTLLLDLVVNGVQKHHSIVFCSGLDCHSLISGMMRLVTLEISVGETSTPYSRLR
jgi:hypothetical protein